MVKTAYDYLNVDFLKVATKVRELKQRISGAKSG